MKNGGCPSVLPELDALTALGFPVQSLNQNHGRDAVYEDIIDFVATHATETDYNEPGQSEYSYQTTGTSCSGRGKHPSPAEYGSLSGIAPKYTSYAKLKRKKFRIDFQCPFKTLSAAYFLDLQGRQECSSITTWPADTVRIQDKIPGKFLGPHWKGSQGGSFFHSIGDVQVKFWFILNKTHWGHALSEGMKGRGHMFDILLDQNKEQQARKLSNGLKSFYKRLWERIKCFLSGKHDPIWNDGAAEAIFADSGRTQNRIARAQRFLEMLKTVDGMFTSRFTSLPEEVWTWDKFDNFALNNISHLISDEFFDGEFKNIDISPQTAYEALKAFKKTAKLYLHGNTIQQGIPKWPERAPQGWLQYIHAIASRCYIMREGPKRLQCLSYLIQTRCAGTPPPLVVLKSKMKALIIFSTQPDDLKPGMAQVIAASVDEVIKKIPDSAFTGLHSKAAVNATAAACWEYKRRECGSLQGVKDIIAGYEAGAKVPIVDLVTGKEVEWLRPDELSLGSYIFWAALKIVMKTDPDELSKVMIAMAIEPGKARTVTKGVTAVKVVLDVINHLCSWPLAKGLESSSTGMKASHHAWNVFKSFYKPENRDEFFKVEGTPTMRTLDGSEMTMEYTYRNMYSSSTDFNNATDFLRHDVAKILSNKWMYRVGIPPVLRGLVNRICYMPRKVYFSGSGPLMSIGEAAPTDDDVMRRVVWLRRGVLMGDPLTKVTLHLVNASVRAYAENAHLLEFCKNYIRNPEVISEGIIRFYQARDWTIF